jgi:hypothetical protein
MNHSFHLYKETEVVARNLPTEKFKNPSILTTNFLNPLETVLM